MGYESRIYIVSKEDYYTGCDERWGEVIATYNMCVYPPIADFMREQPATDCYIYASDGNTKILRDCYDKPLTEASLSNVIALLEKQIAAGDAYRRVSPLLNMLYGFNEKSFQFKNLVVLHYGY